MAPFAGSRGRRSLYPETCAAIEAATGCLPVPGFQRVTEPGDALVGADRVSGFCEIGEHAEWLVRLSSPAGLAWETALVPATSRERVLFVLNIGFGNGSPLPQPTGAWQILVNDRAALRIRDVNHSQRWQAGDCAFAFAANRRETAPPHGSLCLSSIVREESWAVFGPALLQVPAAWLEPNRPAVLRVRPVCDVPSTRWLQIAPSRDLFFQTADIAAAVELLAGERHPRSGAHRVFFGDIHTHSGQVKETCDNSGCGRGSRRENYEYARGPGALDFYALTEHEWQVAPDRIGEYLSLADEYDVEGRFVCLPAFEFTDLLHGHRCAYFRGPGGTVVNANRAWGYPTHDPALCRTPAELWAELERTGVPFFTAPHHSSASAHPLNLELCDPRHDRLFEVYSCWGSSEYYGDFPRGMSDRYRTGDFREALARGLRMGLIASSDGHDGHPGAAQSPGVKFHHLYHFCGSGRVAVLAPELTRAAVFDALYARRCYATTGVPIVLDLTVNGAVMGSALTACPAGTVPQLRLRCRGAGALDHVRIVKNGSVVHTRFCHGEETCALEWEDADYDPALPASYYVRVVQTDRESAWSSPVWVEGVTQ